MTDHFKIQRALISTSDKTGLVEFAQQLIQLNIEILATGGTAHLLQQQQIPVTEVSDYTGFPEIMDGRVKTLHPKIHGGILARRDKDQKAMQQQAIQPIDLIVVNLYPFTQTIAKTDCRFEHAIEQIDIGGPTLLRAAAKNHFFVTPIVDPNDYAQVIKEIQLHGNTTLETRGQLAAKTFSHTAAYDAAIAHYLAQSVEQDEALSSFPDVFAPIYHKQLDLRYGENPHQESAFYLNSHHIPGSLTEAKLIQGKPLSFNNLMDSETALSCVRALGAHLSACVIVKHATPCGVAEASNLVEAYNKAYATDPTSSFGGIIALNQSLDANTAATILNTQFVEVLLVPEVEEAALPILADKPNLRVLACGFAAPTHNQLSLHSISGGLLIQQTDSARIMTKDLNLVTEKKPTESQMNDLLFAWRIARFVKSNAIVYAKDQATLGIGSGQTSRVFSVKIAALKAQEAGLSLNNSVMASDAFFPFADGIEAAIAAGITAVIQPGGSKRDNEVIKAANKAGIAMVFTGIRHFRH